MAKLIFLKITRGSFEEGFEVTLQIGKEGGIFSTSQDYKLPETSENISKIYDEWRSDYFYFQRCLESRNHKRLGLKLGKNSQEEVKEKCRQSYIKLIDSIKAWLNQYDNREFKKLQDRILQELGESKGKKEEVRVFIQTKDDLMNKLFWQAWDIFSEARTKVKVEIALSPPSFERIEREAIVREQAPPRILAILGDSTGINLQKDRAVLEDLGVPVTFLKEPPRQLVSDMIWGEDWDILFFAGHSSSENGKGRIYIRSEPKEYITVENLKPGLSNAIERGLKLAIFNSCDGLELAYDLAELNIPQLIVMREPVPDMVAQRFVKHFLAAFSRGESLYLAVWEARGRLQTEGREDEYPGASLLPIICQNAAEASMVWSQAKSAEEKKAEELTQLRKEFILAKSIRELRDILYRVDEFLQKYPNDKDGRHLKDDIEQAIEREDRYRRENGTQGKKIWRCAYTLTGHSDFVNSVAISPDGQILASGSVDRTIKLWDVGTGELLNNITGHSSGVTCVAFSHDGKTLASSSANPDGTIKLWDPQTGELKGTLKGDDWVVLNVWSIAFSPDGQILVSGHQVDSTVKIWNLGTGELLHTLRGHVWGVKAIVFSPNGDIIVSGGWDSNIKIWNPYTGREIRNLNGPGSDPLFGLVPSFFSPNAVYAVAFSPDGTTIASGGEQQPIQLWRVSNGERTLTLTGHSEAVYSIAFSPSGRTLASGSADRTIRIWDLSTGELLQTLGHSDTVYTVAFSRDGRTLVSGSKDRTVKVWRLGS